MQLRTQVAALALAHDHGLPVPRVIAADLTSRQAGVLAIVTSVLPGSSTIPRAMPAGRARSLGAAAAAIHAVALTPRPDLPLRTRPLPDMDFRCALHNNSGSSRLIHAGSWTSTVAITTINVHDRRSARRAPRGRFAAR